VSDRAETVLVSSDDCTVLSCAVDTNSEPTESSWYVLLQSNNARPTARTTCHATTHCEIRWYCLLAVCLYHKTLYSNSRSQQVSCFWCCLEFSGQLLKHQVAGTGFPSFTLSLSAKTERFPPDDVNMTDDLDL